jgi:hypothetical protein
VEVVDDMVHATRITRNQQGERWFFVTFPESGASGWIRADFIYYDLI